MLALPIQVSNSNYSVSLSRTCLPIGKYRRCRTFRHKALNYMGAAELERIFLGAAFRKHLIKFKVDAVLALHELDDRVCFEI